eukprot:4668644-Amphidinium_carterae.1
MECLDAADEFRQEVSQVLAETQSPMTDSPVPLDFKGLGTWMLRQQWHWLETHAIHKICRPALWLPRTLQSMQRVSIST